MTFFLPFFVFFCLLILLVIQLQMFEIITLMPVFVRVGLTLIIKCIIWCVRFVRIDIVTLSTGMQFLKEGFCKGYWMSEKQNKKQE